MPIRVVVVALVAVLAAGAAWLFLRQEEALPDSALTQLEMARSVGGPVMLNLVRGHVPGRSGEIMLVPKPHNFMISEWDLQTLDSDTPEIKTTHPGPWAYLSHVPIVVRGAGVPQDKHVDRPVDITSIAPTYAQVLGMDGFESPSEPLPEVVGAIDGGMKAIVTVVIDGGGWNLLERYPDAWPNISRLMRRGSLIEGRRSDRHRQPPVLCTRTFGTGFYPMDHGIPGNVLRDDDGEIVDVFYGADSDLHHLRKPTVSELWDEQNDNDAIVGTVSVENWHLGMIGQGALRPGGDKDLAAFWGREDEKWEVNRKYFEMPDRLAPTDLDALAALEAKMDARDGTDGDGWFGHEIPDITANKNERPSTPAFTRFMGDGITDVITEAGIGDDDITDLFWIEMKMPDSAGHVWNMTFSEVEDVLQQTDEEIGRILEELDARIGRENYLFALSVDHGQQPLPDEVGGWRINTSELERDIVARFGPVVGETTTPADLYLDLTALASEGVSAEDVALWFGTYTLGDNLPEGAPGRDLVPADRLDETLYAAAFTTGFLENPGIDLAGLGDGDYGNHGTFPVVYNFGR